MKGVIAFLTAFAFLVFIVPAHAEDVDPKYLIVGGKSIGPVSIGMTLAEVRTVLGPEGSRLRDDSQSLYRFPQVHLMIWVESGKVGRIMVTNSDSSYATAEGFRAGSKTADVIAAYGKPKHEAKVTDFGQQRILLGFDNGVMILTELNKATVLTIGIYDAT